MSSTGDSHSRLDPGWRQEEHRGGGTRNKRRQQCRSIPGSTATWTHSNIAVGGFEAVAPVGQVFEADGRSAGDGGSADRRPRETGIPSCSLRKFARPRNSGAPPVSTRPVSARSATSSGLHCSITALMQLRIASTGERSASRISSLVTTAFRGTPLIVSSPLTSRDSSCSSGKRAADFDFDLFRRLQADLQREVAFEIIDDGFVHFVTGDADRTTDDDVGQAHEATSVVPPPMSQTMLASGSEIGSPAPMPAAFDSSSRCTRPAPRSALLKTARFSTGVMPPGTAITTPAASLPTGGPLCG